MAKSKESQRLIVLAKDIFGQNGFDDLKRYFMPVFSPEYTNRYSYVVFMARRSFNLFDAYAKIYENCKDASMPPVLSNIGLLLKTEELAKTYMAEGRFPSILLCDDIVFFGTGIYDVLYYAEELIKQYVSDYKPDGLYLSEQIALHNAFIDAVDIHVWARNWDRLLLPNEYETKLYAMHTYSPGQLRKLSLRISTFLKCSSIPNTSYVISYLRPTILRLQDDAWEYHNDGRKIYYKSYNNKMLATLRFHHSHDKDPENGPSTTFATALALYGGLTYLNFDRVCKKVHKYLLERIPELVSTENALLNILLLQSPLLQEARAQVLSLLISMDVVREFETSFPENERISINQIVLNCDASKIAKNFGVTTSDITVLFDGLLRTKHTFLWYLIENDFSEDVLPLVDNSDTQPEMSKVKRDVEDYFYLLGMKAERVAYETRESKGHYFPTQRKSDVQTLTNYLSDMVRKKDKRNPMNPIQYISGLLMMMDDGPVAMKPMFNREDATVQSVLKAGEISRYLWPKRYFYFIPALALVENNYKLINEDKAFVIKQFINAIRPNYKSSEKEESILENLQEHKDEFVDLIYKCGQTFTGWDVELHTSEDYEKSVIGDGLSAYIVSVIKDYVIQDRYKQQARDFLHIN